MKPERQREGGLPPRRQMEGEAQTLQERRTSSESVSKKQSPNDFEKRNRKSRPGIGVGLGPLTLLTPFPPALNSAITLLSASPAYLHLSPHLFWHLHRSQLSPSFHIFPRPSPFLSPFLNILSSRFPLCLRSPYSIFPNDIVEISWHSTATRNRWNKGLRWEKLQAKDNEKRSKKDEAGQGKRQKAPGKVTLAGEGGKKRGKGWRRLNPNPEPKPYMM